MDSLRDEDSSCTWALDLIRHILWVGAAAFGAWSYQSDCEGMYCAAVLQMPAL